MFISRVQVKYFFLFLLFCTVEKCNLISGVGVVMGKGAIDCTSAYDHSFRSCWTAGRTRHTVSGFVREAGSGELLIGVNIYLSDHRTGTITNNYGFFSLTLPKADTIEITASYVGFRSETRKVSLHG